MYRRGRGRRCRRLPVSRRPGRVFAIIKEYEVWVGIMPD